MSDYKIGGYTFAQCCKECDYTHNPYDYKVDICPDCGGDVEMVRGRWKTIETKNSWLFVILGMGHIERTEKHHVGFLKKSEDIDVQKDLDEILRGMPTYTDIQDIKPEEIYPDKYTWHKIINDTPFYDLPFYGQQVAAFTFNDDGERIKRNLFYMGNSQGKNLCWSEEPLWEDSDKPRSYWVQPVTHWSGMPYSKQESFTLSDEQIEIIKSTPLSEEDKQWLNMRPVGKEYGSATFDDDDNKTNGWCVVLGQHGPKIHMHTSAGDPQDMLWQAAAILVLAGYKGATGFGVERDGDGRYFLIPETTDPRGIKSYVMPFAYTEEGFEQFATIERYIRDPANSFGLWETAENCYTIPTVLGLSPGAEVVYQWRQEILKECLSVMADRYYD